MKPISSTFFAILFFVTFTQAQNQTIQSPDGKVKLSVNLGKAISYNLSFKGINLIHESPLSMTLSDGRI